MARDELQRNLAEDMRAAFGVVQSEEPPKPYRPRKMHKDAMPDRELFPLVCVFRRYENTDHGPAYYGLCSQPAPMGTDGEPRYPNRFGEPLCHEHQGRAEDRKAFPDEQVSLNLPSGDGSGTPGFERSFRAWDSCGVIGCNRETHDGKKYRKKSERFCKFHLPALVERFRERVSARRNCVKLPKWMRNQLCATGPATPPPPKRKPGRPKGSVRRNEQVSRTLEEVRAVNAARLGKVCVKKMTSIVPNAKQDMAVAPTMPVKKNVCSTPSVKCSTRSTSKAAPWKWGTSVNNGRARCRESIKPSTSRGPGTGESHGYCVCCNDPTPEGVVLCEVCS